MIMRDWKNRFSLLFSALFVSALSLVALPGCEEGTYEEAGEEIDKELEDVGDAMEDAGDAAEDAYDDAADEIDDLGESDPLDDGTP